MRGTEVALPASRYSRNPRQYALMLPALPTGIARTSGARPRSSTISNAPVFWPSSRYGLTELTSVIGLSFCSESARTTRSAASKLPRTATTRAPNTRACRSLPAAIFPAGSTTTHSSPAAAAYAAADAEVFPVEAQMTLRAPSSSAFATAMTMPRSLNDPVGFWPSTFRYRLRRPSDSPRRRAWTSGVAPSPRLTTGVASLTGRNARYRSTRRGRAAAVGTGASVPDRVARARWRRGALAGDGPDLDPGQGRRGAAPGPRGAEAAGDRHE